MNAETFTHDVFLSHSAKDKAVVRSLAERLRQDRLQLPSCKLRITNYVFRNSGTFRFRDPLNKERRSNHSRFDLPIRNLKPNTP